MKFAPDDAEGGGGVKTKELFLRVYGVIRWSEKFKDQGDGRIWKKKKSLWGGAEGVRFGTGRVCAHGGGGLSGGGEVFLGVLL